MIKSLPRQGQAKDPGPGLRDLVWALICLASLLLAGGLLTSCSKSPDPATADSGDFPKEKFLTARGTGTSEMDARNHAMAQLSSIFEADISSWFSSAATSSLTADQAEEFNAVMESKIHVASRVRLQGVRIGTSWKDEEAEAFHALAVLDRMDAGQNWASQAAVLDAGIQAEQKALDSIKGLLSRMAALNRITALAADRQIIESRLRVVDFPLTALSDSRLSSADLGKIMAERSKILSGLQVFVSVQGEEGYRVGDIIAQSLTQKGISIATDPDQAHARVLGQVHLSDLSLKNPNALFVRAQGDILVFETRPQTLFVQVSENIRKGHKDQAEARHKAVEAISRTLSRRLLKALGYSDD